MNRYYTRIAIVFVLLVQKATAQIEDSIHFEDSFTSNSENWEENEVTHWMISINARNLDRLLSLQGVEVQDIMAIQNYIKVHGQIIHLNELHQIPQLSIACIDIITPHITVKSFAAVGEKKSFVNFRWKKSNASSPILRSQTLIQAHPHLSLGGQWSFQDKHSIPNSTAYLDYNRNNLRLIVGDFSPLIGEGKVGSTPSMNNMGWGFTQVIRPLFRIKPYTSTIPMQQWRGIGYTQQIKNFKWLLALPLAKGNQQKIVAFQYKDKTKAVGTGVMQESHFKHWFQAILPAGQHVVSIESVYQRQLWQPSVSCNLVLSKKVKSKWQSQWEIVQWNQCAYTHWIMMMEWNFSKGQYLTLGRAIEREEKDREIGTLELEQKSFFQYQYEPQRYGKFYVRYQLEHKENLGNTNIKIQNSQQLRGDGQWKADENWSLHARAEAHWTNGEKSTLAFQDLQWHPMGKPWKITMRYAIMHSNGWEGRIYAMEKETSGSFYIPAYYGSGTRIYAVGEYKKPHFQIQIKIGKWQKRQNEKIPMDGQILFKIIL
ncbi:MAG: hypothetical protein RL106_1451 [Bacteroidota bacterium]